MTWMVGTNISGYLPDTEPIECESWEDAREILVDNLMRERDNTEVGSSTDAMYSSMIHQAKQFTEERFYDLVSDNGVLVFWIAKLYGSEKDD